VEVTISDVDVQGHRPSPPPPPNLTRRAPPAPEVPEVQDIQVQPPPRSNRIQRDRARQDEFRKKKGAETMERIAAELDKRLCFGFAGFDEAALRQQIELQRRAVLAPVSTRGIGFYTQSVMTKVHQTYHHVPACSVYEAYRVSLAQFSYRLQCSKRDQVVTAVTDDNLYQRQRIDSDHQEVLMGFKLNFSPIANLINAVGNITIGDTPWYFRLPRENIALPHNVSWENLRDTVLALSNPATAQEIRLHFYNHNPLPGARWGPPPRVARGRAELGVEDRNHPQWPLLMNPEDYWPDGYNIVDFEDDVNRFRNLLNWCSRKSVKYLDESSVLDYSAKGVETALMSNYCVGVRNPTLSYRNQEIDWNASSYTNGDLRDFWTPEVLTGRAGFIGALILVGEIPPGRTDDPYGIRTESRAKAGFSH
jgi:hypothetical protein